MKWLPFFHKKETTDTIVIRRVIERQFVKHKTALDSLRAYDEGKKEISTREIDRHFPHIRISP
jgi:hypothetical protein